MAGEIRKGIDEGLGRALDANSTATFLWAALTA